MDRWGGIGYDALVFYGTHGTVLKRYASAKGNLITERESSKVQTSVSSFNWSRGAHAEFTADGNFFWLWLPWRRMLVFDAKTGNAVDAESLRLDFERGRPTMLKTAELLAGSATPRSRIAAARVAGWLNGETVFPILRKLMTDVYHEDTGQYTQAEDTLERYGASPLLLFRRIYPVRRAAAEELHIKFGQANRQAVEELIVY